MTYPTYFTDQDIANFQDLLKLRADSYEYEEKLAQEMLQWSPEEIQYELDWTIKAMETGLPY